MRDVSLVLLVNSGYVDSAEISILNDLFADVKVIVVSGQRYHSDVSGDLGYVYLTPEQNLFVTINDVIKGLPETKYLMIASDAVEITEEAVDKMIETFTPEIFGVSPVITDSLSNKTVISCGWGLSRARPVHIYKGMLSSEIIDLIEKGNNSEITAPNMLCGMFNLDVLKSNEMFPSIYNVVYSEIDVSIRTTIKGYKSRIAPVKVMIKRDYPLIELNREDYQTLINRISITKLNSLNNSENLCSYRQVGFMQEFPNKGSKQGKISMIIDGDPWISYYRVMTRIKALTEAGWEVCLSNVMVEKFIKDSDIMVCQYLPGITDDVLKMISENYDTRLIVDISEQPDRRYLPQWVYTKYTETMRYLSEQGIPIITTKDIDYVGDILVEEHVPVNMSDMNQYCKIPNRNLERFAGFFGEDLMDVDVDRVCKSLRCSPVIIGTPCVPTKHRVVGYNKNSDFPHMERLSALSRSGCDIIILPSHNLWVDVVKITESLGVKIPVGIIGSHYSDIANYCSIIGYDGEYATLNLARDKDLLNEIADKGINFIRSHDNNFTAIDYRNFIMGEGVLK